MRFARASSRAVTLAANRLKRSPDGDAAVSCSESPRSRRNAQVSASVGAAVDAPGVAAEGDLVGVARRAGEPELILLEVLDEPERQVVGIRRAVLQIAVAREVIGVERRAAARLLERQVPAVRQQLRALRRRVEPSCDASAVQPWSSEIGRRALRRDRARPRHDATAPTTATRQGLERASESSPHESQRVNCTKRTAASDARRHMH